MLQKFNFENPEKKPLNELFFNVQEDGVQLKIPALSEHWVQPRCYTKYKRLILNESQLFDNATLDEWLNEAKWFNKDLEFLLSLEHFRFWSYMVYEKRCIEIIVCFLQEAIPFYIPIKSSTNNDNVILIYFEILQNVLRIICRMITNKETDDAWITKEHLKDLLYSKFLISIPMIFDMIIAYGRKNLKILSKIIKTIFEIEPKYNEDLKVAVRFLQNALITIRKMTEGNDYENEENGIKQICSSSFDDLALYTLDCASTLSILLDVYPDAKIICNQIQLEQSITKFYDNTIPLLYKNIYMIDDNSKSLTYLNQARVELLKAFRTIIYLYIENILKEPKNSLLSAESFIAVLTECLSDRTFVVDYQRYYPVGEDIDILKQACKELDSFRADFILKAYTSEEESYLVDLIEENNLIEECEVNVPHRLHPEFEMKQKLIMNMNEHKTINEASRDIASEVLYVLDILPHLGDGFVRRLLSYYDNVENAISAVLENNLPSDLLYADQKEIYIPDDPQDEIRSRGVFERHNVFEGDEYDIMTKCIIKSKKGFPGQPKNAQQLLNDKSYVKEMKERYKQYSMVEDENEYDDEYDDSYDALADSEAKKTKLKLAKDVVVDEVEDSEEESDDNDNKGAGGASGNQQNNIKDERDKSKDFCENPEDIRARYEARRNAKFGNQQKNNNQKSTNNVAGNPKGQGQNKDVLFNRHKKEVNKSSRSNHNRKSGSSWKRSRGMIPS